MHSSNGTSAKIGIEATAQIHRARENGLSNGHSNANQRVDQIVIVHRIVRIRIVESASCSTLYLLTVHIGLHVKVLGIQNNLVNIVSIKE